MDIKKIGGAVEKHFDPYELVNQFNGHLGDVEVFQGGITILLSEPFSGFQVTLAQIDGELKVTVKANGGHDELDLSCIKVQVWRLENHQMVACAHLESSDEPCKWVSFFPLGDYEDPGKVAVRFDTVRC
jgi:hypothetical protein